MTKIRAKRRSRTKQEKVDAVEFSAREEKTRKWITESQKLAIELRQRDRTFHGLVREFQLFQTEMVADYEKSKDVRHPRDVGSVRERILHKFLTKTGLLPKRYAVSNTSVRAVSTTGHASHELDILIYDPLDSVSLMKRENTFEVLPIESAYCAIQIKSKLGRGEIKDAFENIASFKTLNRNGSMTPEFITGPGPISQRGFGLIFAYESELAWDELITQIKECAVETEPSLWSNGIFILSKGYVLFGDQKNAMIHNQHIAAISELQMYGFPNRSDDVLYSFYSILLKLLRGTRIAPTPIDDYYQIPLIAGKYSYEFAQGHFSEVAYCKKHGPFAKKFTPQNIEEMITWCKTAEKINWIRAMDLAYGKPGNDWAAYEKQPGDVIIYNPESLPLNLILLKDGMFLLPNGTERSMPSLAFDQIIIHNERISIYLPYYYEIAKKLLEPCPHCKTWQSFQTNNVGP